MRGHRPGFRLEGLPRLHSICDSVSPVRLELGWAQPPAHTRTRCFSRLNTHQTLISNCEAIDSRLSPEGPTSFLAYLPALLFPSPLGLTYSQVPFYHVGGSCQVPHEYILVSSAVQSCGPSLPLGKEEKERPGLLA